MCSASSTLQPLLRVLRAEGSVVVVGDLGIARPSRRDRAAPWPPASRACPARHHRRLAVDLELVETVLVLDDPQRTIAVLRLDVALPQVGGLQDVPVRVHGAVPRQSMRLVQGGSPLPASLRVLPTLTPTRHQCQLRRGDLRIAVFPRTSRHSTQSVGFCQIRSLMATERTTTARTARGEGAPGASRRRGPPVHRARLPRHQRPRHREGSRRRPRHVLRVLRQPPPDPARADTTGRGIAATPADAHEPHPGGAHPLRDLLVPVRPRGAPHVVEGLA